MIDVGNTYFDTEAKQTEQQGRYHKCRDLTNPKQDGIILLGVGLSLWEDNVMIVLIITTGP